MIFGTFSYLVKYSLVSWLECDSGAMPSNEVDITCRERSKCHMCQISQLPLAAPGRHQLCLCSQFVHQWFLLHHDHPQYLHRPWLRSHHRIDPRHLHLEIVCVKNSPLCISDTFLFTRDYNKILSAIAWTSPGQHGQWTYLEWFSDFHTLELWTKLTTNINE